MNNDKISDSSFLGNLRDALGKIANPKTYYNPGPIKGLSGEETDALVSKYNDENNGEVQYIFDKIGGDREREMKNIQNERFFLDKVYRGRLNNPDISEKDYPDIEKQYRAKRRELDMRESELNNKYNNAYKNAYYNAARAQDLKDNPGRAAAEEMKRQAEGLINSDAYQFFKNFAKAISGSKSDDTEKSDTPKTETESEDDYITLNVQEGDTFGQLLLDNGLVTDNGLWGPEGDVEFYAKQLNDANHMNLIYPGQSIRLKKRK